MASVGASPRGFASGLSPTQPLAARSFEDLSLADPRSGNEPPSLADAAGLETMRSPRGEGSFLRQNGGDEKSRLGNFEELASQAHFLGIGGVAKPGGF